MTQADDNAATRSPGEPRKPLSKEAREEMKRQLKQELRLFADELKKQIRKKEGQKPSLEDAMKKAEAAVEEKMNAEAIAARSRDVMEVKAPDAGQAQDAGQGDAQAERKDPSEHESAIPVSELNRLTQEIIAQLKTIYDPEIPVDIYELGLIYRIDISDDHVITIDMTLTAPGCPVAGDMPGWVEKAVREVSGVKEVRVNLVFDPPWDMSRMSDEARLALNMW